MKDVVIVGGGVAGIYAAYKSASSGNNVKLIEASSKLGGRINSRVDSISGDSIDNGQHLLVGAYHSFIELLKFIGTYDLIEYQEKFFVKYYSKNGPFSLQQKLPGQLGMLTALMKLDQVSFSSKIKAIQFVAKIRTNRIKSKGKTCFQLLKDENQGDDMVKVLWEPLILATINTSIQEADAFVFTEVLRLAFFADRKNGKLIFPKEGLNDLIDPFTQKFELIGGEVLFNTSIKSFERANNKWRLELTKSRNLDCDELILAIPPHKIEKLENEINIPDFTYSPIISVYLWYDKDFMDEIIAALLDTKTQWVFNKRKLGFQNGKDKFPGYLTCTISAADDIIKKSSKEIADICDSELKSYFKADSNLLHYKVIKEAKATINQNLKSSQERMNFKSSEPNLKFVGDWIWTSLPCTIESACRSYDVE